MDPYVEIGRILKPFGVKGELKIRLFIDDPDDLKGLKGFFIRDKKSGWRELVFSSLQFEDNTEFAKAVFPEIAGRTEAEIWRQVPLYVPKELLKAPKGGFFVGELIGCAVWCGGAALGSVDNHLNVASHDMLVVKIPDSTLVVPMTEHYIEKIDTVAQTIFVKNIDELL